VQAAPPERGRALAGALVRWFRAGHRDLPWRRTREPYRVWISEIMLQQTRVEVVVPYYERFVARFPTPHALADAPLDDVLAAWSGLGYYRRARQLHAAAALVVREHAGELPAEDEALRALPGIGRYTAGAIRSIAFGHAAPIVDGNVARVLSRLFALAGGPGDAAWEKRLWTLATALVPAADPSAFNQGLMELGATVCTPRAPRCEACPLARFCRAHAAGREEAYPPAKKRARPEKVERWVLLAVRPRDGAVWMRRRGDDEHNAGQWEAPLVAPDAAGEPAGTRELGTLRHSILAADYRIRVFHSAAGRAPRDAGPGRWRAPDADGPVTTITRKALALIPPRSDQR
jgi:A/G-specific adenine glycosylase